MMKSTTTTISPILDELLVDFPTRSRRRYRYSEDKIVRFAPHITVQPIPSVLVECSKHELWYSKGDVDVMRTEMNQDASALARTLLFPSAKDLEEGGIHVSQAVGLDKHVNPIERRKTQKSMILHQRAVVSLQDDVQNEDELRRVSLCFSLASLTRAHVIAVHWVAMDTNYDGHDL